MERPAEVPSIGIKATMTERATRRPIRDAIPPAVEARAFGFAYDRTVALHDIDLTFPPHAVTAIIGPSGCGKSTFLRSINRLNELIPRARASGDILVNGRSIYAAETDVVMLRQQIGMVFQHPNPFPRSIFDNVAYGPVMNALVAKRDLPDLVERSLRRAALWDEVKDRLDELGTGLAGGQQQRLCIARALANQPQILLVDEPCSALDPVATQKIEELLVELKRDYTIIIVTHNMQQAARVSDFTGFFENGRLIEFGETDQIFTAPVHERTEAYITGRFG